MKNRILDLFSSSLATDDQRQGVEDAIDPERWKLSAEKWISDNPAVALGAALTVGVLLGWLIKRK